MIKQLIPRRVCLKCRGCCRFQSGDSAWSPSLLEEEVKRLVEYGIPPALISRDKKICVEPLEKEDAYVCPLLNRDDNKCKIYSLRPLECRIYPFLICRRSDKVILALDTYCPWAEKEAGSKKLILYTRYLADLLQHPPYAEILKRNPQIIQEYPQVAELVELSF